MSDVEYINSSPVFPKAMQKAARKVKDIKHWEHTSNTGMWCVVGVDGRVFVGVENTLSLSIKR